MVIGGIASSITAIVWLRSDLKALNINLKIYPN